jgi:hypothetical protein
LNNGVISVPNGSTNQGEKLKVQKPVKSLNEWWELVPAQNGQFNGKNAFHLRSFCNLCLDVFEQKAKDNQSIIQWQYNGGNNQVFFIEKA